MKSFLRFIFSALADRCWMGRFHKSGDEIWWKF